MPAGTTNSQEPNMKTNRNWKPGIRLDNVMNVLLIVLALVVLGAGALEAETSLTQLASVAAQYV